MIDTTFIDGTVITANWLNDVNDIAVSMDGYPAHLASTASAGEGAGLVGFNSANAYAAGTVGANLKTLTSPTIVTPAITGGTHSGGTFSSPTLTTPTITTPAVTNGTYSGGTFTSPTITTPAITGGTHSGGTFSSPTLTTPTLTTPASTNGTFATPTISSPTISTPTISGTPVISGSAVTWSGNPTHSGNHTFSGTVTFSGAVSVSPVKVPWTPALKFGGASVGMTYTTQSANYIQIGQRVDFNINIVLSAKGSSVGDATITGFPFTSSGRAVAPLYTHHVTGGGVGTGPIAHIADGTSAVILGVYADVIGGVTAAYTEGSFANDSQICISGFVFT